MLIWSVVVYLVDYCSHACSHLSSRVHIQQIAPYWIIHKSILFMYYWLPQIAFACRLHLIIFAARLSQTVAVRVSLRCQSFFLKELRTKLMYSEMQRQQDFWIRNGSKIYTRSSKSSHLIGHICRSVDLTACCFGKNFGRCFAVVINDSGRSKTSVS